MTGKTLYLHIGAGKTGTSTIQATLGANFRALLDRGVLAVPGTLGLFAEVVDDPVRLAPVRAFAGARLPEMQARFDTAMRRFARREANPVAVASSEHFHGIDRAAMARRAARLAPLADRVAILFWARHPVEKMAAMLGQMVRDGWARLDDPAHRRIDRLDSELDEWAELFGAENLIVRPFERGRLYRDDPFFDLCAAIGRPDLADAITPERRNEGLSAAAVLIADALAGLHPAGDPGRAPAAWLGEIGGPKWAAPADLADAVAADAARQLAYLREAHGVVFAHPPALLSGEPFDPSALASLARVLNAQAAEIARLRARLAEAG